MCLWLLFAIGTGWLSYEYTQTRQLWSDAAIYDCKDVEATNKEGCERVKGVLQASVTAKMDSLDRWKSVIVLPFLILSIGLLAMMAATVIAKVRR